MRPVHVCPLAMGVLCVLMSSAVAAAGWAPGVVDPIGGYSPARAAGSVSQYAEIVGVVTAVDRIGPTYGFFVQTDGTQPLTGFHINTAGWNHCGALYDPMSPDLTVGDSVRVAGMFENTTFGREFRGMSGAEWIDDVAITRLGRASTFPSPLSRSPAQVNYIGALSQSQARQYEGMLVQVDGPLRVARLNPFRSDWSQALLVSAVAPSESILVDGGALCRYGADALNTIVDGVRGVLLGTIEYDSFGSALPTYVILIRGHSDVDDRSVALAPRLVDAFAMAPDTFRVVFNRPMDFSSCEVGSAYALNSFRPIVTAAMLDSLSVAVVSAGDPPGCTLDGVTVSGVLSARGVPMSVASTRAFAPLPMTVECLQARSGVDGCGDVSSFARPDDEPTRVTLEAVVVDTVGSYYWLEDSLGGPRRSIFIQNPPNLLPPGHRVKLVGRVQELGFNTVLTEVDRVSVSSLAAVSSRLDLAAETLTPATCQAPLEVHIAEDFESCQVDLGYVRCKTAAIPGNPYFIVTPLSDSASVGVIVTNPFGASAFAAPAGSTVSVRGVLGQLDETTYVVTPLHADDLRFHGLNVGVHTPPMGTRGPIHARVLRNATLRPALELGSGEAGPERVSIEFFDVAGRSAARLGSLELTGSPRAFTLGELGWTRPVPGTYWCRISAMGRLALVRLLVLGR